MCNPSKLLCKLKPEFCWSVRACIVHFLLNYFPSWQLFLHLTAVASCSKLESDLFTNAFDLFRTSLYCLSYTLNCFLFIDAFDLFWTSPVSLYCSLWTVYCFAMHLISFAHPSAVYCFLFIVHFLLVTVFFEPSTINYLLFSVCCLFCTVCCLLLTFYCLLLHITSLKILSALQVEHYFILPCFDKTQFLCADFCLFTFYILLFTTPFQQSPNPHAVDQGQMLPLIFLTLNSKCNYIFMQEGISFQL